MRARVNDVETYLIQHLLLRDPMRGDERDRAIGTDGL